MTPTLDRAIWTSAAILAALLLSSIFHQPVGWAPVALAGAVVVAAVFRPYDTLLAFAALGPLATMIFVLLRTGDHEVRYHETLALAFIGGFALRCVFLPQPPALSSWLYGSVVALYSLVAASGIVSASIMVIEEPSWQPVELLRNLLVEDYFILTNPLTAAGLFAGGLLMMLAVARVCGGDVLRQRNLARMLMIGAAAAASLNLLRLMAVAIAREDAWATFLKFLLELRVNVHFRDLNAAGSYFALALFVAAGLLKQSRTLAALCGCLIAAGLWISGSRAALAAVLIVGLVLGLLLLWRGRHRRLAFVVLPLVIAASIAGWAYYPSARNTSPNSAIEIRAALARGALEMARANPVFGVGVGRFYVLSTDYTLPQYGQPPRENAHNNFLQVLAELGIPGLALFLSIVGLALTRGVRAARQSPVAAGLVAGAAAYLLTCMAGHPLLVDATAYPFWIALSLAAMPAAPSPLSRRSIVAIAAALILVACTLPLRLSRADAQANLESVSAGFSLWQRESDGTRYRWAGGRSNFFAPADATAVVIPLRAGTAASSPVEVRIFIDRRQANEIIVEPGGGWSRARVLLTRRSSRGYARIDLESFIRGAPRPADAKSTDTSGLLMVGRPEFEFPPGSNR